MLIVDSGCDQCIVNKSVYVVEYLTNITFDVDGALTVMKWSKPLEVVHKCITCINFKTSDT